MDEETELQRGEVTLQDPIVRACRATLRIKVSRRPGRLVEDLPSLPEEASGEVTGRSGREGWSVGTEFPPGLSHGISDTRMGPRAPQSWLPCLPERAGVQPGTWPGTCDCLLPVPERRAVSEPQPPSGLEGSLDEGGAVSVSPPAPQPLLPHVEWVFRAQGVPQRWLRWGRAGWPV